MDSMKKAISFRRKLEFIKRGQFGEESNHAVADYNEIRLSSREWMGTVLLGAGLSGGVAWIFFIDIRLRCWRSLVPGSPSRPFAGSSCC